jgi:hypothetical protein
MGWKDNIKMHHREMGFEDKKRVELALGYCSVVGFELVVLTSQFYCHNLS